MRRQGDTETGGHGDRETGRRGDAKAGDVEVYGLSAVKWLKPKVEPEKPKPSY